MVIFPYAANSASPISRPLQRDVRRRKHSVRC